MHKIIGFLACLPLLASVGCATSGDMEALTERVASLESRHAADSDRIAELEQRFGSVESTAERAAQSAADAEAGARAAEESANDAARKADAIFKKSVSK